MYKYSISPQDLICPYAYATTSSLIRSKSFLARVPSVCSFKERWSQCNWYCQALVHEVAVGHHCPLVPAGICIWPRQLKLLSLLRSITLRSLSNHEAPLILVLEVDFYRIAVKVSDFLTSSAVYVLAPILDR